MTTVWESLPICEIGSVVTGGTPRDTDGTRFQGTWPFITPSDLEDTTRTPVISRFLSEAAVETLASRVLPAQSICFTCIGATIGKLCLTNSPALTNQQINSIVVNRSRHDPKFVYYRLLADRDSIKKRASGAATPIISKSAFAEVEVLMPPLRLQQKIAAILSAYDDLIENNTRRIKVLEEMAQRIYREWFVDLRDPGHGGVPRHGSELGPMPAGWRVGRLGEWVTQATTSVAPHRYPNARFEHFSIPAFDKGQLPRIEHGKLILSNKFLIDAPSVLYSKLNPRIRRVWWAEPSSDAPAIASTELMVLRPQDDRDRAYLFAMLNSAEFAARVVGLAGGTSTSHQRIRPAELLGVMTVLPPPKVRDAFHVLAEPVYRLRSILLRHAAVSRASGELLLRLLMSREIDVEKLDIAVEDAVA
jgi:type I restriction enzyme S subunit